MQELFFGLFDGRTEDKWGWLEPVAGQGRDTVTPIKPAVAARA
jgi:branched-chain amino acid aminotransferase